MPGCGSATRDHQLLTRRDLGGAELVGALDVDDRPVERQLGELLGGALITETIFGRRRPFPDLQSANRVLRDNAERAALNSPIQGSAADIMKIAMIGVQSDIDEQGLGSRMLLQVHDELIFDVAPGEEEALESVVRARMAHAVDLSVPLEVQVGHGANWDAAAH